MNQTETNDQYLEINRLTKYFGEDRAVDGISFNIPEGKFLTLLVFAYFCLFLVARSYKLVPHYAAEQSKKRRGSL